MEGLGEIASIVNAAGPGIGAQAGWMDSVQSNSAQTAAEALTREGMQTAVGNVAATNAANAQEAYLNRTWQRQMEEGRYQRTVTDMKKAGLNPAVIFGSGGGSPGGGHSGAQAHFENAAGAIAQTAVERARIKQHAQLIASEIKRNGMDAIARGMELRKVEPEIKLREAETQSALEQAHEYSERAKSLSLDNEVKERKNVIERKIPWLTGGYDAIGSRIMPAITTGLGLYLGKRFMRGKMSWRDSMRSRAEKNRGQVRRTDIDEPLAPFQ